ncbi:MAG: formylglycine-generating enzyme family protein [Deltaproteobacteria bacterium]|nr:formylglycine-generating enzyme family protein [Deltaproteobacteria bacterium]
MAGVGGAVAFTLLTDPDTEIPAPPEPAAAVVASTAGAPPPPAAPETIPAVPDLGPCPEGMVHLAGGKFFMGTDRDVPLLAAAHPAHQVEVDAYCIDIHEVSVDQYRGCSTKGECKRAYRTSQWPRAQPEHTEAYSELCNERYDDRGQHPINCVTWQQAQHYCQWRGGRLPTEAEWEFAARGSDGRVYPWGDTVPGPTHMNGCGAECRTWRAAKALPETPAMLHDASDKFPGTAPVGSFPEGQTQWGMHDVAGNVFEWTTDAYRPYPGADVDEPADADEPPDPEAPKRRVIRGGAFNSFAPDHADPALRFPQDEQAHTHGIGFRCASGVQ